MLGEDIEGTNLPAATFSISPPVAGAPSTGPFPVTLYNVPIGTYRVTFNPLSGYTVQQPSPETQMLDAGKSISFTGTYVPITLTVCPTASPTCSQVLSFSDQQGNGHPSQSQSLAISSSGPPLSFAATAITNPIDGPWLTVTPSSGTTSAMLTVTVASNLKAGTYSGTISIVSNEAANSPQQIMVTLVVTQGSPAAGTGTINVDSAPVGAGFQINGPGLTHYSGNTPFSVKTTPAGVYTITWDGTVVGGFLTPSPQSQLLADKGTVTFIGKYTQIGPNGLLFPVFGEQPYTATIASVTDHNRDIDIIVSYAGDRGRRSDGVLSVKAGSLDVDGFEGYHDTAIPPPNFLANNHFEADTSSITNLPETGFTYQHPGYDYPYPTKNGIVLAPTSGTLYVAKSDRPSQCFQCMVCADSDDTRTRKFVAASRRRFPPRAIVCWPALQWCEMEIYDRGGQGTLLQPEGKGSDPALYRPKSEAVCKCDRVASRIGETGIGGPEAEPCAFSEGQDGSPHGPLCDSACRSQKASREGWRDCRR